MNQPASEARAPRPSAALAATPQLSGLVSREKPEEPAEPAAQPMAQPETAPEALAEPVSDEVRSLSNEEVTGHTAGLWKYIAVSPDSPEPHSEYDVQTLEAGRCTAFGARVRGKKHKHEGSNCDDWFTLGAVPFGQEPCLLVAVADGAGSKKLSRIGAQVSCETAVDSLKQSLTALIAEHADLPGQLAGEMSDPGFQQGCAALAKAIQDAVCAAWTAVDDAAAERAEKEAFTAQLGRPACRNDLSATLLLTALLPVQTEKGRAFFTVSCQIGDGMVALIDPAAPFASAAKLLGEPDSGDFAGETDFLTAEKMKQPEQLMPRTRISRGTAGWLFLMTDGVADDYFPNDPQIRRLYLDLLANGVVTDSAASTAMSPEMLRVIAAAPEPVAYPWVNDPSQTMALYSVKAIAEAAGLSPEKTWSLLPMFAHAAAFRRPLLQLSHDPAERLKLWLDHYVERGSFDDRTLVAVRLM